jgi:succinyl-CoA synthetase beta subunit
MEDVQNIRIDKVESNVHTAQSPYMLLRNVSGATVSGFRADYNLPLFLRLEGENTKDVKLIYNDFSAAGKIYEKSEEVSGKAVISQFNIVSSSL